MHVYMYVYGWMDICPNFFPFSSGLEINDELFDAEEDLDLDDDDDDDDDEEEEEEEEGKA